MKAQKKPVIIDYFDPKDKSSFQLGKWIESFGDIPKDHINVTPKEEGGRKITVKTLEGTSYEVTDQDVIIRGIKGEYYPCKKDIFEQTYDKIEDKPYTT